MRFPVNLFGAFLMLMAALSAHAGVAVVVNASGQLSAKGADGVLRILAQQSEVMNGDTLYTGARTYARLKFSDGSMITLRPDTHFKVENYHFEESKPAEDKGSFNLFKGGLRAVSGLVGKRGDPDSYKMVTPTATIGIRGTDYGARLCNNDCKDVHQSSSKSPDNGPSSSKSPENGLYVDVSHGTVQVSNEGGSKRFNAGDFGFVKNSKTPPVSIPFNKAVPVNTPASVSSDKPKKGTLGKNQNSDECVYK